MLAEAVLLDAERPLLLLPKKQVNAVGKNIVIAWNGSAEAARAVAMSYDLLRNAKKVTVVTVGREADPADLVATLKANDVRASATTIASAKGGVSKALQREAQRLKANLLIIGAYSHNRMREFVLGGVTMDLFEAPPLPVLMVH